MGKQVVRKTRIAIAVEGRISATTAAKALELGIILVHKRTTRSAR